MFSVFTTSGYSQIIDSIQEALKSKPKIIFKFDSRNTFIDYKGARIFGWKVGVEFNDRIQIGGGFSNLITTHDPELDRVIYKPNGIDTLYFAKLKFNYLSYYAEYIFYHKKKWEFSVPVQLGFGASDYEYRDENRKLRQLNKKNIILFEPAVTGQYKITKWFGVGAGVGFRLMLVNNKAINKKFNAPVYVLKIHLFFVDIYKSVFLKNKEN